MIALANDTRNRDTATITAVELRAAFETSAEWLDRHAEAINSLNVFPVPDGDTGLNMSLTLRAAAEAATECASDDVPSILGAIARGALMGARGNSGVILAQYLRGMARAAEAATALDGGALAQTLEGGSQAADSAVARPVEGTILTVARAAARAARDAADQGANASATLGAAHTAAQEAVERTPDQLPVLREAGVIDAGGEGFRVILEGLLLHVQGAALADRPARVNQRADLRAFKHDVDTFGYCTEVLFRPASADLDSVRARVAALGTSVLVVGDDDLIKVHVHTLRPGAALDLATELGEIVRVKVDNMRLQFEDFAGVQPANPPPTGTAVVAVAPGAGFRSIFESLDAIVVDGGQSMNPPVADIVAAIERAPRQQVVILPNNRNIILAAEQAIQAVNGRQARVFPTHNVCQGIAATLAISPEVDADANLASAARAVARCVTIELTHAARDTEVRSVPVRLGAWIAVVDGELVAGPDDVGELVGEIIAGLGDRKFELVTVYDGVESNPPESARIRDVIASKLGVAVEHEHGGQPHYPYIISLE